MLRTITKDIVDDNARLLHDIDLTILTKLFPFGTDAVIDISSELDELVLETRLSGVVDLKLCSPNRVSVSIGCHEEGFRDVPAAKSSRIADYSHSLAQISHTNNF